MAFVEIELKDTLSKIFRAVREKLPAKLRQLDQQTARRVRDGARDRTPVDTGEAQDGWKIRGTSVRNDVKHIRFLEGRVGILFPTLAEESPRYFEAADDAVQEVLDG